MATYTDDFDRGSMGTTGPGGGAYINTDTWTIVTNEAQPAVTGVITVLGEDFTGETVTAVEADLLGLGLGFKGVMFRGVDDDNFWAVGTIGNGIFLGDVTAGAFSTADSATPGPPTPANIRVEITNTNDFEVFADGISQFSFTDTGPIHAGGTICGLWADNIAEHFDDLTIETAVGNQDFTDTDSFSVYELTENSEFPAGAQVDGDLFGLVEDSFVVKNDGVWNLCPPYGVALVPSTLTVASCGGGGYEDPTTELYVSAPVALSEDLPWWEFTLYDASGAPINLDPFDEVVLDVAASSGQFAWQVDCTVLDGPNGVLQTKLFGGVIYSTRTVTDGVTTNTDATVTSATAAFTAADVGAVISGVGIPVGTTIASINSGTSIEMSAPATATATGVTLTIGAYAAAAGDYDARFDLLLDDEHRSVPTYPIQIHILDPGELMANHKCLPKIPYPKWAEEQAIEGGYKSSENWAEVMRWARLLLDGGCIGAGEFTASWAAAIGSTVSSMLTTRYYPPGSWSISQLRISLDGNQTGDLTFAILVNSVSAATITLPSLANYAELDVTISGVNGDYLQYSYVEGGNGGQLLTMQGIGSGVSAGLDFDQISSA